MWLALKVIKIHSCFEVYKKEVYLYWELNFKPKHLETYMLAIEPVVGRLKKNQDVKSHEDCLLFVDSIKMPPVSIV